MTQKNQNTTKTDVVVIGAGPAGCVAAAQLLKHGFEVTILEKTTFPRFVIGESLLPKCMDILEETNLLEAVSEFGFQKKYGAKFTMGNKVCDFDFSEQFTKGHHWTWQVTRADFDQILADEVAKMGAKISYNATVEKINIATDKPWVSYKTPEGEQTVHAKFVIDGSGYGRVLPKLLDLDRPSDFPPRKAFFTHVPDPRRPAGIDGHRIQVIVLAKEVWVWIIPFANGNTSVGVVGDLSFLVDSKSGEKNFETLVAMSPILKDRFAGNTPVFPPKIMAGYATRVKQFYGDKFVLCGNSTEFIDPIFSSGVTLALTSGSKAGKMVAHILKGETVNWDTEYVQPMQQGIDTFRSYVEAWYDGSLPTIFFADAIDPNIKNQICSVLAGYVWDLKNPFVKKHTRVLKTLAKVIQLNE